MTAEILHASAVSVENRALLILGPSGAGKSGLALNLMALGAKLIADDRTVVTLRDGHPFASCPDTIRGQIEARGIGILAADPAPSAPIVLAVDLGQLEAERMPPVRHIALLGYKVPLLHKPEIGHFPAALMQYLKAGRLE